MKKVSQFLINRFNRVERDESGQSIVLIALVFLVLLAFVGLAVDAGFAFARSSQFSRAVDAAATAGVVDLLNTIETDIDVNGTRTTVTLCTGIACADLRAQQYLSANGWPTPTLTSFLSARSFTRQGIPEYTITVTWPVDFFFATLIGLDDFPITHHASAAFAAQSDIYMPTQEDFGQIRAASTYIIGKAGCTVLGDPVSPQQASAGSTNEEYTLYEGKYRYRIRIPETYTATSSIRIELFDPDTANFNNGTNFTITHSDSSGGGTTNTSCGAMGDGQSCFAWTGENLDNIFHNPYWLYRVDENYNQACGAETAQPNTNTVTTYELYYLDASSNRQDITTYVDDNSNLGATDMKWVTPTGFDVDFTNVNGSGNQIPIVDRFRYIYLDVSATGSAKNVWDIRVGPDPSIYAGLGIPPLASDVNARNLQIANGPAAYNTYNLQVFALGRYPAQYYVDVGADTSEYEQRMIPLPISLGEGAAYASVFDFDTPNTPYVIENWGNGALVSNFTIDTLPTSLITFTLAFNIDALAVSPNPDPLNWESECNGSLSCDGRWFRPQYSMGITSPAFAGGTLIANFDPNRDAMVWSLNVTSGRPFLTR